MNLRIATQLGLAVLALAILAVVPPPQHIAPATHEVSSEVFEGTLPCADCPGIDARLTLVSEVPEIEQGSYELSLSYRERSVEPYVERGVWETEERGMRTLYRLLPEDEGQSSYYERMDADTVRPLTPEGEPIDAPFSMDLTRTASRP